MDKAGLVIGKSGHSIRGLRISYHLGIKTDDLPGSKLFTLTGAQSNIEAAVSEMGHLIREKLHVEWIVDESGNFFPSDFLDKRNFTEHVTSLRISYNMHCLSIRK